jgi:tRNA threonylcarbamoyladenosine biosynthesis protein TsaB
LLPLFAGFGFRFAMRVLAIDTALEACSAAVLDSSQNSVMASESQPMSRGHAEALVPLIARVMNEAEISFAEIDRIAVTTGPGSFTGLRVGLAAARGIALAAGKPVVGLSTLMSYAAPYTSSDEAVPVVAAIDARHAQVFLQVFGSGGRTLVPPRIASLHEAVQAATAAPSRLVGSAADAIADAFPAGAPAPVAVDSRRAPDIEWVARLGAAVAVDKSPPKPFYLRAPDAQPQDAAQLPRR